jgi:thiamine biosynthesis lipoprotein
MTEILRRHAFSITFIALFLGFVFFSGGDDGQIERLSGLTMGTSYEIQLVDVPENLSLDSIAESVQEKLNRLDREIFSTYAPDSELSRFNRHPVNQPFAASAELREVLLLANEISMHSDGAFDVTVGPVVNLWGFGPGPGSTGSRIPDEAQLAAELEQIGFDALRVDQQAAVISKTRAVTVDLSAIAKGYAVDRVGEYFDSLGLESYFIEIGGELKMKGLKPGGLSWVPAIEAPVANQSQLYEVFFSRGEELAVAGSGDYRNYFEENGQRYSHEIDPRTGRPIQHNLAAVYVIDQSAARADALATAYLVLGLEAGRQLATESGQAVYFIYKAEGDGFDEFYTDAFANYLSES